jgi:hypothetical protein
VRESLDPKVLYLLLYAFILFWVARFCYFLYNQLIAPLSVHVCLVDLLCVIELGKHDSPNFINIFMNKNNGSQLSLILKLHWKITTSTLNDPMYLM